ncbi:flagellar hook-length control protein FliK [Leifsonia sp. 1010]|uniref:flagellar hook-length control protein FliK n=1 Tax=Leifsonia sp. 1010 TaxID=2817769 RepID=UPI002867148A|nr:flagellar hook-length control protein FliK [Leifsonia sp. 1010]MDR6611461.1 flagellar hook-length control protein FliK [Leifsonia sp. 1010]
MSPATVTSASPAAPSTAARPGAGATKGSADAFDAFLQGAVDATPRDAHGGSRPKAAREHDRGVDKPDASGAAATRDTARPAEAGGADGQKNAAAGTDGTSAGAAATGTETASSSPTAPTQAATTVPGLPAATTSPVVTAPVASAPAAPAPAAASPLAAATAAVAPSDVAQIVGASSGAAAAPQPTAATSPVSGAPAPSSDIASPLGPNQGNESPLVATAAVAAAAESGEAGASPRPARGASDPAAASRANSGEAGAAAAPTTGIGGAAPASTAPAAVARTDAGPTAPLPAPQTATAGVSAAAVTSAAAAPTASTRPEPSKTDPVAAPTAAPQPLPGLDRAPAAQPVAAPASSAPQPTLGAQLARPVFTLAAAGAGEHVMTVHVTPDTLGPVTVRAHVGGEGVRVELFAPTDAGRDALRAILPDLRRDLGGAGLTGTLDLSSQNQPAPQHDAPGGGRHGAPEGRPTATRASEGVAAPRSTPSAPADGSAHTIDLIV